MIVPLAPGGLREIDKFVFLCYFVIFKNN